MVLKESTGAALSMVETEELTPPFTLLIPHKERADTLRETTMATELEEVPPLPFH